MMAKKMGAISHQKILIMIWQLYVISICFLVEHKYYKALFANYCEPPVVLADWLFTCRQIFSLAYARKPEIQQRFHYDLTRHIFVLVDLREYLYKTDSQFFESVSQQILQHCREVLDLPLPAEVRW